MGLGPQGTRGLPQPGPRLQAWTMESQLSPPGSPLRIPEARWFARSELVGVRVLVVGGGICLGLLAHLCTP